MIQSIQISLVLMMLIANPTRAQGGLCPGATTHQSGCCSIQALIPEVDSMPFLERIVRLVTVNN